jgi:hypothetical protein
MEFWITIVGLVRRKQVIIPALLVALALGALAFLGTPNTYVSTTTMVLTTSQYGGSESQDPTKPTDLTNPILNFNESLKTTSAILIEAMNTNGVKEQLGAVGPTTLVVDDGRSNPDLLGLNGPFLYVVGQSTSSSEAKRVVQEAQTLIREKLGEWQLALNAPETTYVSLVDVVPPTAPVPGRGRATKLGLMAFIFGFLLSMGIAYFRNQVRARRRVRATAAQAVVDTARPLGGAPEKGRGWRPSRSPVLFPEGDDEDAKPAVVPTPLTKSPQPAVVPTPLRKNGEPSVLPAPVKRKVGSRSR